VCSFSFFTLLELAMQFDNRPPINLESATQIACASRYGGAYKGIGRNAYAVYEGQKLHLVHSYVSGCDYGYGCSSTCVHLGMFPDRPALIAFLLKQQGEEGFPWWASELLESLGYAGEQA
jgi:hypothetical protein